MNRNLTKYGVFMGNHTNNGKNIRSEDLKFIHTADLHLGSSFCGISNISGELAKKLSKATFTAFDNIISLCIENEVDFLLISGDIYDSADRKIYEQLEFRRKLEKLSKNNISVYLAFGNHDPLNGWSADIKWPENVQIMPGNEPECFFHKSNGTKIAAIVGMSYKRRDITSNLTKYYPAKENSWPFTIGLLHCNLGTDTGHEPYSPCSLNDLSDKDYDYWALGHIHKPSIIKKSKPAVIYSGNPQGRDIGESGPRGCYMISVKNNDITDTKFIETSDIRWEEHVISIEKIDNEDELVKEIYKNIQKLRKIAGGKPVFCRLRLTGRSPVHSFLIREGTISDLIKYFRDEEEGNENFVYIERIIDNTEPAIDLEAVSKREDIIGDIIQISDSILESNEKLQFISSELDELFNSNKGRKYIEKLSDDELKELVKEAEIYLLDQFVGENL